MAEGEQLESLSSNIDLQFVSQVQFLRLIPLVGG